MTRRSFPSDPRRAFTLFEMLLVVALIALLAGVVVVNVGNILGSNQETIAKTFVDQSMKAPLTAYRIHVGSYPTTAEGLQALISAPAGKAERWKGPYIDKLPNDPWGNPYQYRYPGVRNPNAYDLFSYGPDGVESDKDIGNW
jgi:general secretion pathway protein G